MKCNVRGVLLGLASAGFMLFFTGCSAGSSGSSSNNPNDWRQDLVRFTDSARRG